MFMVRMETPIDYSVKQVEKYLGDTEQMMQELPGVKSVYYVQGYGGYANKALIMINLVPKSQRKHTQEELKKMARTKLRTIPGLKVSAEDISAVGGGIRNVPIQYSIRGQDLAAGKNSKTDFREFSKLPGITDGDTSLRRGKPEFKVFIDRDGRQSRVDVASVPRRSTSGQRELDIARYKDEQKGKR